MKYAPGNRKTKNDREDDKRTSLRKELKKLVDIQYKNKLRIDEIKKELEDVPEELEVTLHAVQRFKERIENVPNKIAKSILSDDNLLRKYKEHGEGKYKLTKYPNVLAVVSNFKVVTVYPRTDVGLRLVELTKYMDYWIEKRCQQEYHTQPILPFKEFRKTLYK